MNSIINRLFQVSNGGSLTSLECQQINIELASLKLEQIPLDQRDNVTDYLLSALNHDSVEPQLASRLTLLLNELQQDDVQQVGC